MSKFNKIETGIEGLFILEPTVFEDGRGFFLESYHKKDFEDIGLCMEFVQDNHSKSSRGVLRGLHFQVKKPQGKLIRVVKGEVFDVAVDLRVKSATYKKWYGLGLSEKNKRLFYVPEGFAHGFLVVSDSAELQYKCTNFYDAKDEGGILWNAPEIGIAWPLDGIEEVLLSEKDKKLPSLFVGGN